VFTKAEWRLLDRAVCAVCEDDGSWSKRGGRARAHDPAIHPLNLASSALPKSPTFKPISPIILEAPLLEKGISYETIVTIFHGCNGTFYRLGPGGNLPHAVYT